MLSRATHVLVGVIEAHHLESWPKFRVALPADANEPKYWRVLRRRIRVETVLRGELPKQSIDVYEVFWTGGASGNWNSTQDGERAVFLLRVEQGYYRLVQDWWRSIFPVTTGPHRRAPLDDTHPLWERIALMNFWFERANPAARFTYPQFRHSDPGSALSLWRTVKLQRGLLRHPSAAVRVAACRELRSWGGWGQDECWEMLSADDKTHLQDSGYFCCTATEVSNWRRKNQDRGAARLWQGAVAEERRLLTAMNNRQLRAEFCRLFEREYPGDHDNGCPADRPPPATIVTENGDVPLLGPWPR